MISERRDCWLKKCTTVLHGGVCHRNSTPRTSGNKMKKKKHGSGYVLTVYLAKGIAHRVSLQGDSEPFRWCRQCPSWSTLTWRRTAVYRAPTHASPSHLATPNTQVANIFAWFYTAQYPVRWTAQTSKLFTLQSLTDLFIPTPTRLLWEAFSHTIITAWRLLTHISTTVYSKVLIYIRGWTGVSWIEPKWPNFETVAKGIRTRALSI